MSTGLECAIMELAPGKWYYVLQRYDCPVGAWDWMEYAKVVGPYLSEDRAFDGLRRNEANPGGYSSEPYDSKTDYSKLLSQAVRPRR